MPGDGKDVNQKPPLHFTGLLGAVLGHLDVFTWASLVVVLLYLYIEHTSWGPHLKAVGIRAQAFRYGCVVVGAMLMGLAAPTCSWSSRPPGSKG